MTTVIRLNFITQIMETDEVESYSHTLWAYESKFLSNGIPNRRTTHYWSDENPHRLNEVQNQVFWNKCVVRHSWTAFKWFKNAISDVPTLQKIESGNKSYYIESILTANYYQATQFCNFHKMSLLTITSQNETNFLKKTIYELGISKYRFWTSGTVLPSSHWVWMSTGHPIVYTNWGRGEPNGPASAACIETRMDDQGFRWNDLECSYNLFFICESPSTNLIKKQKGNCTEIGSHLGEPPSA